MYLRGATTKKQLNSKGTKMHVEPIARLAMLQKCEMHESFRQTNPIPDPEPLSLGNQAKRMVMTRIANR